MYCSLAGGHCPDADRVARAPLHVLFDEVEEEVAGQPMTEGPDRLMLGDTRLIFLKNDKAQPSSGSAIDHIGFSFADLDAKLKEFEAGGV